METTRADAADNAYFRNVWPRRRPSQKLVAVTVLSGMVLVLVAFIAYLQISRVFALIDQQRQYQANINGVFTVLARLDDLLRGANRQSIDAAAVIRSGGVLDMASVRASMADNTESIERDMASISNLLVAIDDRASLQDFERMQQLMTQLLPGRTQMIEEYAADRSIQNYMSWRDRVQAIRTSLDEPMVRIRSRLQPVVHDSQQQTDDELSNAFLFSCAALGTCGLLALVLGGMLVRYTDQRDQVEAHLRRTTDMWTGIINSLKQGVAVFDYSQRLLLWNPRYVELQGIDVDKVRTGMSANELLNISALWQTISPEAAQSSLVGYLDRLQRGEMIQREVLLPTNRKMQIEMYPMGTDCFVVTLMDMTEIRRAEQLARDQAVRLGTIMNNVPDAIVTINSSGSIESWNAGAQRMFGYEASEVIHRNVSVLMTEPHASHHDDYIRRYLQDGDREALNRLRELTARRHDGTEFPIDLRISEMDLGEKRMFTGIIRDITERRAVEQLKSEFISTVSHELRTPLTSIIGSLTLLVEGVAGSLSDKAKRLIGMAEKNSQRLGRLINDILDLEKVEAGRMNLRLDVVNLLPVLHHSLELNQSYAAQFAVELRLNVVDEPILVRADEVRMLQVMSNLLSNAIKSSPAHAQVLVDVQAGAERVRVTVHDDGPGIADEFKGRVFQRFAQADNSDARRAAGTGLGLAITKQLVELHAGQIGYQTGQSAVGTGRGASFWFELPRVKPALQLESDTSAEPLNMHVVLCEDDPDVAEVLIEMLHLVGCQVRHTGVSSGVRSLLSSDVSALLVDIDLPDQNGLNLVKALREEERWGKLPVVVVSGTHLNETERARHEALQISGWLDKPVDRSRLRAALRCCHTRGE